MSACRACVCMAAGLMLVGAEAPACQEDALGRARRAIGRPEAPLVLEGETDLFGLDLGWTLTIGTGGEFVTTVEGRVRSSAGYDGSVVWERDWNGTPRVLILEDRDVALFESWAISGAWAWEEELIELRGVEGREDAVAFSMSDGALTGVVELDGTTWLPKRFVLERPTGEIVIEVADYQTNSGVAIPTAVRSIPAEDEATTLRVRSIERGSGAEASFDPALGAASGVEFDATRPAELELRRAPTGHLLVRPLVAGRDVGWFIFDSGAGSGVLSPATAGALGLEGFGRLKAMGVGGQVETGLYVVEELTIGPVTLHDQILIGLDLSFLTPYFGVEVAGILGYELLSRCVARVDMAAPSISLHDPAVYALPEEGEWGELLIPSRVPAVVAGFEGHEGVFKLDTGAAGSSVTLHSPVVERLGMLEGRDTVESASGGVGGMVKVRRGVLRTLTIAGRTYENVPAEFGVESVGAFADAYTAGNIGGVVLSPFVVVFDYPNRRVAFVARGGE